MKQLIIMEIFATMLSSCSFMEHYTYHQVDQSKISKAPQSNLASIPEKSTTQQYRSSSPDSNGSVNNGKHKVASTKKVKHKVVVGTIRIKRRYINPEVLARLEK